MTPDKLRFSYQFSSPIKMNIEGARKEIEYNALDEDSENLNPMNITDSGMATGCKESAEVESAHIQMVSNGSPRKRRGSKQPRPFSLAIKNSNEESYDPHLEKSPSSPALELGFQSYGMESPYKGK